MKPNIAFYAKDSAYKKNLKWNDIVNWKLPNFMESILISIRNYMNAIY